MSHSFPAQDTMVKYLALLSKVLITARHRASDKQIELLDAVHNLPDLLCRWPDMNESWVLADLEAYEAKYCEGTDPFTGILKRGPDPDWQLVWKAREENKD